MCTYEIVIKVRLLVSDVIHKLHAPSAHPTSGACDLTSIGTNDKSLQSRIRESIGFQGLSNTSDGHRAR